MENLLFEDVPSMVSKIWYKLNDIECLISEQQHPTSSEGNERWFSIDELCDYLPGKPARATVYGYVHHREIPHKKLGKRLAFLKSEIDEWLKSHGRKTVQEIETEADNQLSKN